MAKVADYISKNICVIRKLIKVGSVPLSLMQNYDIYQLYLSTMEYEDKQMKRYLIVANRCKCSIETVRKAVREMQKPCN